MKTLFFLFLFFIKFQDACSQEAPLNQFDPKGKKHGKWIVRLDENWKKVKSPAETVYFRYTWYDHGSNIYPMGECGGKGYKLEVKSNQAVRDTIQVLDGEYTWYNADGKISSVHVLKNGEYISCKEYYPTGELSQYFDYTKKCEGQEHSWCVSIYDKTGKLTSQLMTCKDKNGNWPLTRD